LKFTKNLKSIQASTVHYANARITALKEASVSKASATANQAGAAQNAKWNPAKTTVTTTESA